MLDIDEFSLVNPQECHLLVIDDDADQLLLVSNLLSRNGYKVTSTSSPRDALRRLAKGHFDLIVCDLNMREMDGLEFVEHIRSPSCPRRTANIPIIILTASGLELQFEALKSGADLYCVKREASALLPPQIQCLLSLA